MQKDVTTDQRSPLWIEVLAGLVCVLLLNGCISPRVEIPGLSPPQVTVCEIARDGVWPRQVIAVLPLCGEIRSDESLLWPGITSRYAGTVLAEIKRYSQVKALVLQIDSPGGSVHATDRIYHLIEAYHRQTGVPVYAVITGIGASGAYYVACAAREIFAEPTSVVGSIGVIMRIPLLKDLADKVGYRETIIKSGVSKDMGHPLKPLSQREYATLQEIIDHLASRFKDVVKTSRKARLHQPLEKIADGRVFTSSQAVELGLIDRVAYLDEALKLIARRNQLSAYRVLRFELDPAQTESLYASRMPVNLNLFAIPWQHLFQNRLEYRWSPEP